MPATEGRDARSAHPVGGEAIGQRSRECPEHRIDNSVAGNSARAAGRGMHGIAAVPSGAATTMARSKPRQFGISDFITERSAV